MSNKTYKIVKICFNAPLHLSRGQTDAYDKSEEVLHSDTLKSALFVASRMLFGDETDASFFDKFRISSAFPFKVDEYFLPKPMAKLNLKFDDLSNDEIGKLSKRLKKLNYISKNVFQEIAKGNEAQISKEQVSDDGRFLFTGNAENQLIYATEIQQRLTMPKHATNVGDEADEEENQHGKPYYIERIHFAEDAGLYFFLEISDESFEDKLKTALRLLGDEGVGTDRNVGNGFFTPKFVSLEMDLPENANSKMLLSLYCPQKEELTEEQLEKSSYQIIKRGGYIAGAEDLQYITFRKKSVYMFQEASVFPTEMEVKGKVENLQPKNVNMHPVWRDGYAFTIPVMNA